MKLITIENTKDLQEFLQRIVLRIELLEKEIAVLDFELSQIGEQLFTPASSKDS